MNKEQLKALEKEIKDDLNKIAESCGEPEKPILDGIVDIDCYLSSHPKILWILKEPWDEGDLSIAECFREGKIRNIRIFRRVTYTAYAVFNDYRSCAAIPRVKDDLTVWKSLWNIAYVNVKKFSGKSQGHPPEIESYYDKYQRILKTQIAGYSPDVVIGGGTLYLFLDYLGLKEDEFKPEGKVAHCSKNGRLYIHAYHPSRPGIGDNEYVDGITAVIKEHYPHTKSGVSGMAAQVESV